MQRNISEEKAENKEESRRCYYDSLKSIMGDGFLGEMIVSDPKSDKKVEPITKRLEPECVAESERIAESERKAAKKKKESEEQAARVEETYKTTVD